MEEIHAKFPGRILDVLEIILKGIPEIIPGEIHGKYLKFLEEFLGKLLEELLDFF